ncbi:hypothetical protein ABZY14_36155 [Streptomyces sp. NPDC006617]|uniref:hypothetical protein n=1 Tax=Streptomyces sp. NPDC006617 TaxID=3155354 RepID=UPI0033B33DF3
MVTVQRICAFLALISLAWIGFIGFLATPDALLFAAKRGFLIAPVSIFILAAGGWIVTSYRTRKLSGR